jgi:hypothetical protein
LAHRKGAQHDKRNRHRRLAAGYRPGPQLTAKDLLAGYYYAGADETGLSDELLQESFDKLAERGYFEPVLVLDEQASFDVRKTLPKANR